MLINLLGSRGECFEEESLGCESVNGPNIIPSSMLLCMVAGHDPYDPLLEHLADKPDAMDYSIPGDLILLFGPPEAKQPPLQGEPTAEHPSPWRKIIVLTPRHRRDWYDGEELNDYLLPEGATACVRFRGADYDVTQVAPRGSAVAYELRPADPSRLARRLVEYSRSAELHRRASGRAFRRAMFFARFLWPLYPLLGALPIEWQTSLGTRVPIDVQRMVDVNLVSQATVGIGLLFWQTVLFPLGAFISSAAQGSAPPEATHPYLWVVLGSVLLIDALIRWRLASRTRRLTGFIPVELLWRVVAGKDE